jgi:hypothetical protein
MRRFLPVLLALVAATAVAAVAFAQTAPTVIPEFKVTPAKAGTKKQPKNALVYTKGTLSGDGDYTIRRLEYTIPPTIKIDGTGFKTCTTDFINMNGDEACPKGSKVGTGAATALLGPQKSRLDFDVDVYAAGPKSLAVYLQTSLFNVAISGTIKGRIVAVDLPESVQRPVPGLYAYVTSIATSLGKQNGIPATTKVNGKTRYFASTTGCKNGQHAGSVEIFLVPNPDPPPVPSVKVSATSRCST